MAADNSRMPARRIEETFDGADAFPRDGSQPSQYEERVWFAQFQDPDQVFRYLLTYRIGGESDLLRLTSALETVCEAWPQLRVRFSFGEDGTLARASRPRRHLSCNCFRRRRQTKQWPCCTTFRQAPTTRKSIRRFRRSCF